MSGTLPWSTAPPSATMANDPNELLNRVRNIDQTTTQIYHWVRLGMIVLIVLALVIVFIG